MVPPAGPLLNVVGGSRWRASRRAKPGFGRHGGTHGSPVSPLLHVVGTATVSALLAGQSPASAADRGRPIGDVARVARGYLRW